MKRSIVPLLLFAGLLAATTACSSTGEPPGPSGTGGGDRRMQSIPNLFISPSGKPYRAPPDQPYAAAQWFAAADADHDGHLTRDEFRRDAEAFFKELDANHDGVIDGFEIQHYEREVAPEINPQIDGLRFGEGMDLALGNQRGDPKIGGRQIGSGRAEAGDRRPEGAGLFGLLNEPEPVAATDTHFDGHITLEEFQAAADRRFTSLDKKALGYLTLDTLPKTPVQVVLARQAAQRAKQGKSK